MLGFRVDDDEPTGDLFASRAFRPPNEAALVRSRAKTALANKLVQVELETFFEANPSSWPRHRGPCPR